MVTFQAFSLCLGVSPVKGVTSAEGCFLHCIDGEKVETVTDFIFLGSQITVDGDCSHEIKKRLLLGRKAMTNLDRDITLPTKICIVKAIFFPVVIYGYESWTIKKAESQRIDAF